MEAENSKQFTRDDLFRVLKGEIPWKSAQIDEYLESLSMDELMDLLLEVYRDSTCSEWYQRIMLRSIRRERYKRSMKEVVVDDKFLQQLKLTNQKLLDEARIMYDDFARLVVERRKMFENPLETISCCAKWDDVDQNYTFGYSHPIKEDDFDCLIHLIYKEMGAVIPGLRYELTNSGEELPPFEEVIYPKDRDFPEKERDWNKEAGLPNLQGVCLCYPIIAMQEKHLTFEDIFAIKELYHVITIEHRSVIIKDPEYNSAEEIANVLVQKKLCSTEAAKSFAELAMKGANADKKEQMRLLMDGYIDNCGISLSVRTAYYQACEGLFYSLPENKGKLMFYHLSKLNSNYTSDYDRYDICGLNFKEAIDIALKEKEFNMCDEPTSYALCYGLWLSIKCWEINKCKRGWL